MSRPLIVEHNLETNEVIEREMNDLEYAQHLKDKATFEAAQQKKEEAEALKATLLTKLGITAEEAKLLLS